MPGSENDVNSGGADNRKDANYLDNLSTDEHQYMKYNFKEIPFPIKDDKEFQTKWLRRIQGNYDFPD